MSDLNFEVLSKLKDLEEEKLLALKGVVGVSVGFKVKDGKKTGILSIRVLVKKKRGKLWMKLFTPDAMVPLEIGGFPTDVVEVGEVKVLSKLESWKRRGVGPNYGVHTLSEKGRSDKWRPAPGGVSIGHKAITAGTFGGLVKDRATNKIMILSNNHVLANSDMTNNQTAYKGDSILQPGKYDGGKDPTDKIAKLERWIEINPFGANEVDCAAAVPLSEKDVDPTILEIGKVSGVAEPELNMKVQKSGRTTGLTRGEITDLHATIRVQYPGGYIVTFKEQTLTGPMLQGGDSGALLLDLNRKLVGLGFAGSDQVAVFNKISKVLEALKINPVIEETPPTPPPTPKPTVKMVVTITVDGRQETHEYQGQDIKVNQEIEAQSS